MGVCKQKTWLLLITLLGLLSITSANAQTVEFVINGVEDSDVRNNINIYLKDVRKPVTEFDISDYTQKITAETKKAVQAFGFYNASIQVELGTNESQQSKVTIDIKLNDRTMVTRVVVQSDILQTDSLQENNSSAPNRVAEKVNKLPVAMPIKLKGVFEALLTTQDKPLNHSQYDKLKSQMTTFAIVYGYFDFKFLLHKLVITPSDTVNQSTATIHWVFTLGERYRFGDVVFLQETRGQNVAASVKPFKTGEFFDQSKIGEYSIDLASTGYFENAIARANAEKSVNKHVPIEVILKPKPRDLYKFGIGFSTDTKARISIDWDRPWVNSKGHSLGSNLYLSNPRKSLTLDYRIPKENALKDFLSYRVGVKQTDENQTESDTISFEVLRQWGAKEDEGWDKIGFLKVEQESFIQGLQERQSTRLVMPGFTINRTRKDGDIFVNWGDRQQLTVQFASKDLLSDIDFVKILARTKWIREYGIHRFTVRADAGAISTNNFSRVPSSQRFFAGGDQSIRGYGYNEVSDIRKIEVDGELVDELVGGKYLSVASVEYAFKVAQNWRVAAFVDAGSASQKFASNTVVGYGLGVHWLSPIGNVQVYLASGNSDYETNWLHIIIGPGL